MTNGREKEVNKIRTSLRVVELFAGVGGFRLGLERAAPDFYRTVWANQWEPNQVGQWAYRCYTAHFGPDHRCVNTDIASVLSQIPEHDFLVGGFPCQDFSTATVKAKGIEGKKGSLWWTIDAIVRQRHPAYMLLENVDRLLRSPAKQRGRDFGIMLKCLDTEGYAAEWRVLNAADYGHCQRRRRAFLFAFRPESLFFRRLQDCRNWSVWLHQAGFFAAPFPVKDSGTDAGQEADLRRYVGPEDVRRRFQFDFRSGGVMWGGRVYTEPLSPVSCTVRSTLEDVVERGPVETRFFLRQEDLAKWKYMKGPKKIDRVCKSSGYVYRFTEGAVPFPDPLDRPARTILTSEGTANRSTHIISDPMTAQLRRLTPEECEAVMGFPRGWTDTGMPERQRYFTMGNALVVPMVERMGTALAWALLKGGA